LIWIRHRRRVLPAVVGLNRRKRRNEPTRKRHHSSPTKKLSVHRQLLRSKPGYLVVGVFWLRFECLVPTHCRQQIRDSFAAVVALVLFQLVAERVQAGVAMTGTMRGSEHSSQTFFKEQRWRSKDEVVSAAQVTSEKEVVETDTCHVHQHVALEIE
jgi:hypothetical protein